MNYSHYGTGTADFSSGSSGWQFSHGSQAESTDPRVTMHMLPLPKTAPRDTDASDKKSAGSGHHDGDAPAAPVKPKKEAKPSPKAKALCPDELKGYQQRDAQNNTIC